MLDFDFLAFASKLTCFDEYQSKLDQVGINKLCSWGLFSFFDGKIFVTLYAIAATIMFSLEVITTMKGSAPLWPNMNRKNVHRRQILSDENRKRLSLGCQFVTIFNSLLMLLAIIFDEPALLIPWLIVKTIIVIIEYFIFVYRGITRLFLVRSFPVVRDLFILFVMTFTYMEVYCCRQNMLEN